MLLLLSVMALCTGISIVLAQKHSDEMTARLISTAKKKPTPWVILDEVVAQSGGTIPSDTNVIFHLPLDMQPTTRAVLFGQKDNRVRYWGYCFPDNYEEQSVTDRAKYGGLPGAIFLSRAEREARQKVLDAKKTTFSLTRPPTQAELDAAAMPSTDPIQNQIDEFEPGNMCFIMTAEPLAYGVDSDDDLLNNKMEHDIHTLIDNPDTDQDGISDGIEFLHELDPRNRDTDGDGIIDGLEDANWNGLVEMGETDPRKSDSDKDGLCDGVCRMVLSRGKVTFLGEDANLNGKVDTGETNPLKWSTLGNGVSDFQAYLNCQLGMKEFCVGGK